LPATQKGAYTEVASETLEAEQADVDAMLAEALDGIEPDSAEMRALGAIIGSFTADAAAQPCHWNYAQSVYQQELKNLGKWDACEFMNPSLNAFYRIPCGTNSCYCDQAYVIMESLAAEGCVDPDDIDERFEEFFAEGGTGDYGSLTRDALTTGLVLPIDGKWRHGSITGYMRNVNSGMHWPRCGTSDSQIDSCVKIVPVVAMYAGHEDMLLEVEDAIRVSQDNEDAVAFGLVSLVQHSSLCCSTSLLFTTSACAWSIRRRLHVYSSSAFSGSQVTRRWRSPSSRCNSRKTSKM
jgi:hypothetical protein